MLRHINMFKKGEIRHFEYSNNRFLYLFKSRSTGSPINPRGMGYVPPESSSGSYYGGGGTPSPSGTVYVYKGVTYSSEADVKNAIAKSTLESQSVQTILRKQGGGSSTVYVYKGTTYASQGEVQSQISKDTAQSSQVQQARPSFAQPTRNIPGMLPFTAKPFSQSNKYLESDVVEREPSKVQKGVTKVSDYTRGFLGFETSKERGARLELSKPISQVDYSKIGTEERLKLDLAKAWRTGQPLEEQEKKLKGFTYEKEGKTYIKEGKEKEYAKEYDVYENLYGKSAKSYEKVSKRTKFQEPVFIESATPKVYQGSVIGTYLKGGKEFIQFSSIPYLGYTIIKEGKKGKTVKETIKSLPQENIPTFLTGTGYGVGTLTGQTWFGGALITAGSTIKGIQADTFVEKPTWKGAGTIVGKSAATGALFAGGGIVVESLGSFMIKGGGQWFVPKIITKGALSGKNLVTTYFVGQIGKESVKTVKEFGYGIKTGEFQPFGRSLMGLSSSIGGYGLTTVGIPKTQGLIRTFRGEKIPIEKIGVTPETIPLSSKITESSLRKSFKEGTLYPKPSNIKEYPKSSFLPKEDKSLSYMWHATSKGFGETGKVEKGTSEVHGLYGAPVLESYFLKVKPSYSLSGETSLFEFKSPSAIRLNIKGFEKLGETRKLGYAQMPFMKPEYEAVLTPETMLIRERTGYYTKVRGTRVPIQQYRAAGEGEVGITLGKLSKKSSGYSDTYKIIPFASRYSFTRSNISKTSYNPSSSLSFSYSKRGYDSSFGYPSKSYSNFDYDITMPSYKPQKYTPFKTTPYTPSRTPPYYPAEYSKIYPSFYEPPKYTPYKQPKLTPFNYSHTAFDFPSAKGILPKASKLIKSRPYRYTPNLVGLEFGKALRKTPKGSQVWSGFELRPLVKGGF